MIWLLFSAILLIVAISILIIISHNDLYLFLFHHNLWEEWYEEIGNAKEYHLDEIINGNHIFSYGSHTAIVWGEDNNSIGGLCSVSSLFEPGNTCILTTYYRKPSRRMAKKLLKKVKRN